jgi:hypothetical protein
MRPHFSVLNTYKKGTPTCTAQDLGGKVQHDAVDAPHESTASNRVVAEVIGIFSQRAEPTCEVVCQCRMHGVDVVVEADDEETAALLFGSKVPSQARQARPVPCFSN